MSLSKWATVGTGPFRFGRRSAGAVRGPFQPEARWQDWLASHFPAATSAAFAERHLHLWDWIDALTPGVKPRPRVELWPRGGAKSSTAELGVARVGAKKSRMFAAYVSATQGQANKHVQAIAARFEAMGIGRAVNGYGNSLGWRMDLLRAENGFNLLALGLDSAGRGVKIEDFRIDLFVLDDVDERHDSPATVKKKIETITDSILPGGSADAAVLFIQNRIHGGSIASQLADGTADFLLDREVHEEPAVRGLAFESDTLADGSRRYRITAGEATWQGQNLATCERQLNEWGRGSFMREAQHETAESEDGLWDRARDIDPFREKRAPEMFRIVVAIDPNATDGNDDAGIIVAGAARVPKDPADPRKGHSVHGVVLEDASVAGGPKAWAQAAVDAFHRWEADALVAESNNGGEMVAITIGTVPSTPERPTPKVKLVHASRGKRTRAEPIQKLYEDGRVHHIGVFVELEKELCSWQPGDPSPNRLDANVWALTELLLSPPTIFAPFGIG